MIGVNVQQTRNGTVHKVYALTDAISQINIGMKQPLRVHVVTEKMSVLKEYAKTYVMHHSYTRMAYVSVKIMVQYPILMNGVIIHVYALEKVNCGWMTSANAFNILMLMEHGKLQKECTLIKQNKCAYGIHSVCILKLSLHAKNTTTTNKMMVPVYNGIVILLVARSMNSSESSKLLLQPGTHPGSQFKKPMRLGMTGSRMKPRDLKDNVKSKRMKSMRDLKPSPAPSKP